MRCGRIRAGHALSIIRAFELMELFRKRHPEVLQKIAIADDNYSRIRRAKDGLSLQ